MISIEQSEDIFEHIVPSEISNKTCATKILREHKWGGLLIILPLLFMTGSHFYKAIPNWCYVLLALLLMVLIAIAIYHDRTPVVSIDKDYVIYYGFWPWNKKTILIEEVTKVLFFPEMKFLRLGQILLLQLEAMQIKIWIETTDFQLSSLELSQILCENFGAKYMVSPS